MFRSEALCGSCGQKSQKTVGGHRPRSCGTSYESAGVMTLFSSGPSHPYIMFDPPSDNPPSAVNRLSHFRGRQTSLLHFASSWHLWSTTGWISSVERSSRGCLHLQLYWQQITTQCRVEKTWKAFNFKCLVNLVKNSVQIKGRMVSGISIIWHLL